MVQINLPKNSKVEKGEYYKDKTGSKNIRKVNIYRWDPSSGKNPRIDTYEVDMDNCPSKVLDLLNKIKNEIDPSIAYRRSCAHGVCGSCAMNMDGKNGLACTKPHAEIKGDINIYPLPHLKVQKDLIGDLNTLYKQYQSIEPWLKNSKKDDDKEKTEPLKLNLENLDLRKEKLTINSSNISDYVLNKDASKVYYLTSFEKGYDLWVTEPRTRETKILAKMGGSPSGIEISDDDKTLFMSNHGKLVKVDAEKGSVSSIDIDGDMRLDTYAERQYMFDHMWRQVVKKFYDPTIHGINWQMYHDEYAKFLPQINNNYDFQELLSELLGELNASHTGGRYRPQHDNADVTASLGLLFDEDYAGEGIKVDEVIAGGPVDKANNKIKKGDIITAIAIVCA